jgi:putative oxidoreductase
MTIHSDPDFSRPGSGMGSWLDRPDKGEDVLLLLARVGLGAIFVQSGFGKLTDLARFTGGLESMGVPYAPVLGAVGAAVEFLGGLALVLGAWTWLAAALVAGFTVVATLLAHRFWDYPAEQRAMQSVQFMKNLAVVGGLLAVVVAGAGRFSVDGLRQRSRY